MALLAMSDIHGCFNEFTQMLDLIKFDFVSDTLVLCGDYIDHGTQSYEMVDWLIKHQNPHLIVLRGNHEEEFIHNVNLLLSIIHISDLLLTCEKLNKVYPFFDYYGTIRDLIKRYHFTIDDLVDWKNYFQNLRLSYKHMVYDGRAIFCHAGFIKHNSEQYPEFKEYALYNRGLSYLSNYIVVYGHTPTVLKNTIFFNDGNVYCFKDEKKHVCNYNIDCGIAFKNKYSNAKLACLCLDNKEVFYI